MQGFEWDGEIDADKARTLFSLVKYNGGAWKSEKQAAYLRRAWCEKFDAYLSTCWGIPVPEAGQFYVKVEGTDQYGYGSRGMRPIVFWFLCDARGVVAQFRIHYSGNMRDGCSPNPARTETRWQRAA